MFEPIEKGAIGQYLKHRHPKGHISVPFSFIIWIKRFKRLIECIGESRKVSGVSFEFDQPFMGAIVLSRKINGSDSVVANGSIRFDTGESDRFICIFDDDFLTKSIDK